MVGAVWVRARACQSAQFSKFKLTQCAISGIISQNGGLLFGFGLEQCGGCRDFGFPSCSSWNQEFCGAEFIDISQKNKDFNITFMVCMQYFI